MRRRRWLDDSRCAVAQNRVGQRGRNGFNTPLDITRRAIAGLALHGVSTLMVLSLLAVSRDALALSWRLGCEWVRML